MTAGIGMDKLIKSHEEKNDRIRKDHGAGARDRLAEAFAEKLHLDLRIKEWISYEVKIKREKLRCLLLHRKKKIIFYIFMM